MHLKVELCQTLRVVSTFTGQNEWTASIVLLRVVKNSQLTDFDHYSY